MYSLLQVLWFKFLFYSKTGFFFKFHIWRLYNLTGLNVERCYIGISIVDMFLAYLSVNDDVCWLVSMSVNLLTKIDHVVTNNEYITSIFRFLTDINHNIKLNLSISYQWESLLSVNFSSQSFALISFNMMYYATLQKLARDRQGWRTLIALLYTRRVTGPK